MKPDPAIQLFLRRAGLMAELEACSEEEFENCYKALVETDEALAQHSATSRMGKALSLAFLEYEIKGLLGETAPEPQREIIMAYLANLRRGLPKVPPDVAEILAAIPNY